MQCAVSDKSSDVHILIRVISFPRGVHSIDHCDTEHMLWVFNFRSKLTMLVFLILFLLVLFCRL